MSSGIRAVIVALFLIGWMSLSAGQSPRGTIDGTVVDAVTGRPIIGAQVRVLNSGSSTTSGTDGQFHLSDIPAGTQNLVTSKDGYLPAPAEGRFMTLTPGQQLKEVVVPLTPNGIVTGTVLDSRGEPVAGADIVGYREAYDNSGERQFEMAAGGQPSNRTNDRGEFRIFQFVEAGEYVFQVVPPEFTSGSPGHTFAPLYFPGTADPAKAGRYVVKAGEETDLKYIVLPPPEGGILHVSVIDQSGAANPNNQVLLQVLRKDMQSFGGRGGPFPSGNAGKDVGRLPSGHYEIYATASFPGQGVENRSSALGHTSIEIFDRNVDTEVVIRKGARLTGRFVTESSGGTAVPISGVGLRLTSFSDPALYRSLALASGLDGAFAIASVPAGLYEMAGVTNFPQGMVVKSIEAANRDVLADGLSISGADVDMRVVLGKPAGGISGTVTDANDGKVRGANVILLGPDKKRGFQPGSSCQLITAFTDQNGEFEMAVPLSGTYRVLAGKVLDGCAPLNADFMKKNEAKVVSIRVDEGARVIVNVKLLDP